MDVGGWLRGLGLGQYEANFRDNKIGADLLPRLTVDDLKDIGVSLVGDRRRLLDAIAVLAGAKRPADVPAPHQNPRRLRSRFLAERRPITVMFCDLVGSTSLAAKLDAEDWRNLVNAYLDEASAAVTGLGGHVLKRLGDGLMALFGYPLAQENDAERAVRAALAIQRALAETQRRNAGKGAPEFSARIGLESGPVVVEATGEVFGDAPNLAARVQAAAEPGAVLVTAPCSARSRGCSSPRKRRARAQGPRRPVSSIASCGRAAAAGGGARPDPLCRPLGGAGPAHRRWERARGEGQLALIVGEPGSASRGCREFRALGESPQPGSMSSSQLLAEYAAAPDRRWGRQRSARDAPTGGASPTSRTLCADRPRPSRTCAAVAPLVDVPLPPDRAPSLRPRSCGAGNWRR